MPHDISLDLTELGAIVFLLISILSVLFVFTIGHLLDAHGRLENRAADIFGEHDE